MCNNHNKYHGSSIEHGEAHTHDHNKWNRRQFLSMGGLFAAGTLMLRSTPVTSLIPNDFTKALKNVNSDNILVLIRLFGGNDGLNTIIPHNNSVGRDKYLEFRPNLGLSPSSHYNTSGSNNTVLSGFNHTIESDSNQEFAMPGEMSPLMTLWGDTNMSVIHNVGYPTANFSHFDSTDFWSSGTNNRNNNLYASGWMGRYLNEEFPDYLNAPPSDPPAILIGSSSDLTYINCTGQNMGLTFPDVNSFYNLVNNNGISYSNSGIGNTCASDIERRFVRDVARNGDNFSQNVFNAYNTGGTTSYNPTTELSNKLNIIARLIKGGLTTRIYMVTLNGFDFHINQLANHNHQKLLGDMAHSVSDFYADLTNAGDQQKVVAMAYSEFGRTIVENGQGSNVGTDHGSLNSVFLFGEGINGGFHGRPTNLHDSEIPATQRIRFESPAQEAIDFRAVYNTILCDWLCVQNNNDSSCPNMLSGYIDTLFTNPCSGGHQTSCPTDDVLSNGVDDYNNQTETITVSGTITATNVISGTSDVKYDAGQCIELNAGFEVKPGAEFEAVIGGCTPLTGDNSTNAKMNSKKQSSKKEKAKKLMSTKARD